MAHRKFIIVLWLLTIINTTPFTQQNLKFKLLLANFLSQVIPSYQKPYVDIVLESENCSQPKGCSLIDMEVQSYKKKDYLSTRAMKSAFTHSTAKQPIYPQSVLFVL